jgi:hypothetical protein
MNLARERWASKINVLTAKWVDNVLTYLYVSRGGHIYREIVNYLTGERKWRWVGKFDGVNYLTRKREIVSDIDELL